jgi:hypothetical protein
MLSRILMSVVLAVALVAAPVRISARSCILVNAPTQKACQPVCCANKTCCKTSHKNTSPPAQPLAKSCSNQGDIATLPSPVALAVLNYAAAESFVFSSVDCAAAHSPAPLALICIRLI